jgi:ribosomal protein S12 methylthiotransferase accessory factor YcaO
MALCYNTNKEKYPGLIVGLGCHLDPIKAIQKALFEMELMLREFLENPIKKVTMKEIVTPTDHGIFYFNPENRKYWEFMISTEKDNKENNSFIDIITTRKNHFDENINIIEDIDDPNNNQKQQPILLKKIVKHLNHLNHRVFFVNITPTDIRKIGLSVVKVFVTGLQPMYFSVNQERLNLQRLDKISSYFKKETTKISYHDQKLHLAPHPLA